MAGKWHIITLQEAIEYLDHEFLTNRFFVTHHGGCAILFNNDTSHPDIKVSSVYLHDTRDGQQQDVKEEESGWVLQGVVSRASFRRLPRNGKSFFTAMSLHIRNHFAKKRGTGKKLSLSLRAVMLEEHVDLVAGDFNGAAWRRPCENDRKPPVLLKKLSPIRICQCRLAPHRCGAQVQCQVGGLLYVDFSSHQTHMKSGKYDYTGRFLSHHSTLGLREKDQSCHHKVWMHLTLTET